MSDPMRLLDQGASDFEHELLRSWKDEQPSDRARQRAYAVAGAGIGAGSTLTTSTAAKATGGSIASKAAVGLAVAKWLGAGFVAGLAGSAVTLHYVAPSTPAVHSRPVHAAAEATSPRGAPRATHASRTAPKVARAKTVAAPQAAQARVTPRLDAPRRPDSPEALGASPPTAALPVESAAGRFPRALGPEIAALDRARKALTSGDSGRALDLVADYQRDFPNGVLSQEAEVLRIDALDRQGRREEASALARRFVSAHPDSPHADRLRRLIDRAQSP